MVNTKINGLDLENQKKTLIDFRGGKVDKYSNGNYEWLPTRQCFYCGSSVRTNSDYDIYELTTYYSNYESSSGRYFKETKTELWIICSEYDCQTSIRNKSPIEYDLTAQGGNPTTRILETKLVDGVANRKLEKKLEKKEEEEEWGKNNWFKSSFLKIKDQIWAKRVQDCKNGIVTTKVIVPFPKRKDKVELVNQFKNEGLIDEIWDKKRWEKI